MVTTPPNPAQDVLARVSQSALATVENGLHKLRFRAMSTLCRVHCHGASAAVINSFLQGRSAPLPNSPTRGEIPAFLRRHK